MSPNVRRAYLGFANGCERLCALALTVLMGAMALLGFFQVATRFVLHEPSPWSEEFLRRAMIWLVAIGLSIGFRYGSHICVDVINRVRAAWLRAFVRSSVFLLSLVFLVTVAWIGTDMAWRVRFQSFASVELSMTWAYAAIPVGAAFAAIALIAQFIAPSQDTPGQREFGGMACQE
ncbi:TRAP transporter small permease [Hydrogenophaga borbori]